MRRFLKTIAVAVLVWVAQTVLYDLGVLVTSMRDGLAENTVGKLLERGFVSGLAAYGALYAANAWFSNLRLRVLVVTFLLLLASGYGSLTFLASLREEITLRSPVVLLSVVTLVGAAIAAFVYLRQEQRPSSRAEPGENDE